MRSVADFSPSNGDLGMPSGFREAGKPLLNGRERAESGSIYLRPECPICTARRRATRHQAAGEPTGIEFFVTRMLEFKYTLVMWAQRFLLYWFRDIGCRVGLNHD
jgi:hypothetical protein